jgi:hypothetical protein
MDESGSFATHQAPCTSLSVVGALIVPDHKYDLLLRRYSTLRQNLPKEGGEVKGRLLDEQQVSRVLDLLFKNNCIFEGIVIDMGLETVAGLQAHRAGQAESLTRHLTEEHHPNLVAGVHELRARLEAMALPLYAQSIVTIQLIGNLLQHILAYWSLRAAKEILTFNWVIDGKDVGRVTNAEDWWSTTMLGLLQSRSYREPMIFLNWIDYTEFDAKFRTTLPKYLKEHMPDAPEEAVDLMLLMKESFRFSSEPEPGLELADIVTNGTRRALLGNLGTEGWAGIPRLMIHKAEQQYLHVATLTADAPANGRPYAKVLAEQFRRGGRDMLTPSLRKADS